MGNINLIYNKTKQTKIQNMKNFILLIVAIVSLQTVMASMKMLRDLPAAQASRDLAISPIMKEEMFKMRRNMKAFAKRALIAQEKADAEAAKANIAAQKAANNNPWAKAADPNWARKMIIAARLFK